MLEIHQRLDHNPLLTQEFKVVFGDFQSEKSLIAWCGPCTLQQLDVPSGYFG